MAKENTLYVNINFVINGVLVTKDKKRLLYLSLLCLLPVNSLCLPHISEYHLCQPETQVTLGWIYYVSITVPVGAHPVQSLFRSHNMVTILQVKKLMYSKRWL